MVARRSAFFWFWLGTTVALESLAAYGIYDASRQNYEAAFVGGLQLALISPLIALLPAIILEEIVRAVTRRPL